MIKVCVQFIMCRKWLVTNIHKNLFNKIININYNIICQSLLWVPIIVQAQHYPNHHKNNQNKAKKYFHLQQPL